MEAEKAASLAKLHKGLHSPIAEQRDAALKGVSELGELETIAELVRLRGETDEASVKEQVGKLLRGLKLEGAGSTLLEVALLPENADQLADLLGFLWECGGSAEGQLRTLSTRAVEHGMDVMVEALTLFEALPEWLDDEADLLDAMLILQQGRAALQGGNATAEQEMLKLMLAELMQRERA
jgi:hypothetical protein